MSVSYWSIIQWYETPNFTVVLDDGEPLVGQNETFLGPFDSWEDACDAANALLDQQE